MKLISENLGRILASLAAIAVVIGVITCYRADLGEFFMNVISGEQRIADSVLGNMGDFDLNDDFKGPKITLNQELGSSSDNPLGVESSSFTLSGAVTDESGVASLTVNGTNVTVADDGTWSTTLTLTKNVATEVTVVATDSEGNTTKKTGYVVYIQYIEVSVGKSAYAEEIGYSDSVTDLVIPATFKKDGQWYKVTSLANSAFSSCVNLINVTIPDSVTKIGTHAFKNCSNLKNISIPDSVQQIGMCAFEGCKGLESVVLPDSLTVIASYLFHKCYNLSNVVIPDGVTKIVNGAFYDCGKLNNLFIPKSVNTIEDQAFYGCKSLMNVTFEHTDGWYVMYDSAIDVDVSDASIAAKYLRSTYTFYYKWYQHPSMIIAGTKYNFVKSSTWADWCDSIYNTSSIFSYDLDSNVVRSANGIVVDSGGNAVKPTDSIKNGGIYRFGE